MCGIFGFAKKGESQSDFHIEKIKEMTKHLADASVVRGSHSTGLAVISPRFHNIWKSTLSSTELVRHSDWETVMRGVDRGTTTVIGHVRYATHGDITARNSHPFSIGGVIGAHNGIINNHKSLDKELGVDSEVDSEVIFGSINKFGVKEGLEKLKGDYAVTFVKDNPYEIYLAREYSRPMHFSYWKKARTLFWASTDEILSYALRVSGLVLETQALQTNHIFKLDTREFGNKPRYDVQKFVPDESYDYRHYTTGRNYSSYLYGYNKCPLCEVITYSATGICWNCNSNTDIEALCSDCNQYKTPVGMINDSTGLSCKDCQESETMEWPQASCKAYDFCDGCSESMPEDMLKVYGLYSLCNVCDRDDDIKRVTSGY